MWEFEIMELILQTVRETKIEQEEEETQRNTLRSVF